MSDDQLEHKVRIALRVAQMKRKIVPAILIDVHERIETLHEKHEFDVKHYQRDYTTEVENLYKKLSEYYRQHHEIVAFFESVESPDLRTVDLNKLYEPLKDDRNTYEFRSEVGFRGFIHRGSGNHYTRPYDKTYLESSYSLSPPLHKLQESPWLHNQHSTFNTMYYKGKLLLICMAVGDLLDTEPRALPPP